MGVNLRARRPVVGVGGGLGSNSGTAAVGVSGVDRVEALKQMPPKAEAAQGANKERTAINMTSHAKQSYLCHHLHQSLPLVCR